MSFLTQVTALAEERCAELDLRVARLSRVYWIPKYAVIALGLTATLLAQFERTFDATLVGALVTAVAAFDALNMGQQLPLIEHGAQILRAFVDDTKLRHAADVAALGQPSAETIRGVERRLRDLAHDLRGCF